MTATEDTEASNDNNLNDHHDEETNLQNHQDFILQAFLPTRPDHRPEDVHKIIESVDRYNPINIPRLEEYVHLQLDEGFYDRDANLAILKLYQFNPGVSTKSLDTTIEILIKSLTALPDPDFNLSLALLSEDVMEDETIERLIALQQLLEQHRFESFWNLIENDHGNLDNQNINDENGHINRIPLRLVLQTCQDFDASIRDFVALTLSITYQAIDMNRLVNYLGLDDIDDVRDFIKEKGWTTEKPQNSGDVIVRLSSTSVSHQSTKPAVVEQQVRFSDLKKLLSHGRILT